MLEKTNIINLIEKIKEHQSIIANERDYLGDLISEMETLREDCTEAWDNLQGAIEALSRTQ